MCNRRNKHYNILVVSQSVCHGVDTSLISLMFILGGLKGHCIDFKYYADGIHSGLTPPG